MGEFIAYSDGSLKRAEKAGRTITNGPHTFTRVKTITSHVGHSRFLAECADDYILGYIPRQPGIPSPYAYSPEWIVYDWQGTPVIVRETSHKRYEVFIVDGPITPADGRDGT